MEFLDLSSSVGGSGQFIKTHEKGILVQTLHLSRKLRNLRKALVEVEAKLHNANEAEWLFDFACSCQRKSQDFEVQLRVYVAELEKLRSRYEKTMEACLTEIAVLDPGLGEIVRRAPNLRIIPATPRSGVSVEVLQRLAVVKKCLNFPAREIVEVLDSEEIPISEKWKAEFDGVISWVTAYLDPRCRNRVEKMISTDRKRLALTVLLRP